MRSVKHPSKIITLLGTISLASFASALDISVPMEVPRLDGIDADVPVGSDTSDVRLSLGYDEKGKLVQDGACTVTASP